MSKPFVIFLLLIYTSTNANNVDSLFTEYQNVQNNDTTRVKYLLDVLPAICNKNADSALAIAKESYGLIEEINLPFWTAKYHFHLALCYRKKENYFQELKEYNNARSLLSTHNFNTLLAQIYLGEGTAYLKTGKHPKAIDAFLNAIKSAGQHDNIIKFKAYSNIGIAHRQMNEPQICINYYHKAKQELLKETNPNLLLLAKSDMNIANIFTQMERPDSALLYHQKSYEIFVKEKALLPQAVSLINQGWIHYELGNHKDYLEYTLASIEISKSKNNLQILAEGYRSFASYYSEQNNTKEAITYCTLLLDISNKLNSKQLQLFAYEILSKIYQGVNKHDLAMQYLQKHIALKDSMINEKNTREIITKELNFEFEKKTLADSLMFEDAKLIRDLKIKAQTKQSYYLIFFIVLILIFASFIFNRFKKSQKQQKIIEQQKELLNKEFTHLKEFAENASHEIQTPMAIIQSKLDSLLQSSNLTEEHINHISSVSNASQRLSTLNRSLLLLSKIENNQFNEKDPVNFSVLLEQQLDDLKEIFIDKSLDVIQNIKPDITIEGNPFLSDIIISNLLKNAIAHNIKNGSIEITLNESFLIIKNTGHVLNTSPKELFKRFKKQGSSAQSTGLGLAIVQKSCAFSNWTVNYEYSDKQHTLTVSFNP